MTSTASLAGTARGACPSLAAPMPTGDGLLARLSAGAQWTPDAVLRLAEAAALWGSGVVEVTARGNWQVRGLRPETAAPFAQALADLGGEAQVCVDPLAGLDPDRLDARPVAEAIAAAVLLDAAAPKLSILVDGGGPLHLDALSADIRLAVEGDAWRLSVAGDALSATLLGLVAQPVEAVARLLASIGRRRAREVLAAAGPAPFRAALAGLLRPAPPLPPRPPAEPVGRLRLGGGWALGVCPPFGSTDAASLASLARAACSHGAAALRPAPGHALVAAGPMDVAALEAAAAGLGFIVHPADPRRRVAACPGAPACGSALMGTRALAGVLARRLPAGRLHVSGCAKGCAHPGAAELTLVGVPGGIGVVRHGTAHDAPTAILPAGDTETVAAALLPLPGTGAPPRTAASATGTLP